MPRNKFNFLRRRILLLATLAIGLIVLQPFLWRAVAAAAGRYHDQRTQAKQLVNLEARVQEIMAGHDAAAPALGQAALSFPATGSTARVIEAFEQLAANQGLLLTITSLKEQARRDFTFLTPFVVTLQTSGAASDLLQFMDALEHDSQVVQIESWSLEAGVPRPTQPGESPAPAAQTLTMTVQIYMQSQINEPR